MLELEPHSTTRSPRRLLPGLLAASLAALCLWVLAPFLASIAWAATLAYVSWPAYRALRRPFGRSATVVAVAMALLFSSRPRGLGTQRREGPPHAPAPGLPLSRRRYARPRARARFQGTLRGRTHPLRPGGGRTIIRAVFFGIVLSALAQGLIAGIGYRLAGLTAPVVLGALTSVLSVIPLVGTSRCGPDPSRARHGALARVAGRARPPIGSELT